MVVIGGAKVKDKIGVLSELVRIADKVVVGGRMAYTFLAARGVALGRTHVEHAWLDHAKSVMQEAIEHVRAAACAPCKHVSSAIDIASGAAFGRGLWARLWLPVPARR